MRRSGRVRLMCLLTLMMLGVGTVVGMKSPKDNDKAQYVYQSRPPTQHVNPPISEGHKMISRALWRIFDALMDKKEHVARMSQVEAAVKTMITSDGKIEDKVKKMKQELKRMESMSMTLMTEFESISKRVDSLENWQLSLHSQGDQHAANYVSSCAAPYVQVEDECFYVNLDSKLTWQDARTHCGKSGGDLASPKNLGNLKKHLKTMFNPPEYVWVGGHKVEQREWMWYTSPNPVPMDMSHDTWNDELPSGVGFCVGLYEGANYRTYDYNCGEEDYFVCQYYL